MPSAICSLAFVKRVEHTSWPPFAASTTAHARQRAADLRSRQRGEAICRARHRLLTHRHVRAALTLQILKGLLPSESFRREFQRIVHAALSGQLTNRKRTFAQNPREGQPIASHTLRTAATPPVDLDLRPSVPLHGTHPDTKQGHSWFGHTLDTRFAGGHKRTRHLPSLVAAGCTEKPLCTELIV